MATWQDGPEYAPLAPPTGYEPASAAPLAPAADPRPASVAEVGGTTPPVFAAPATAVPLARLAPARPTTRDPREPFLIATRAPHAASPWRSVHVAPQPEAAAAPPPMSIPPIPPIPPFRATPRTGYADLDERIRTTRWLLAPAVLFVLGALAGPWVTAAVLVSAALLGSLPGIRPGARTLSRVVAGLLGSLLLLYALVGRDWTYLSGMSRFVGLVYSLTLATWYLRERAEVEAERRRRTAIDRIVPGGTWPPGPGTPR